MEPERRPGRLLECNHGRHLLAVIRIRVHARQLLARGCGGGAGGGELWSRAAAAAALAAAALATATLAAAPLAAALAAALPTAAVAAAVATTTIAAASLAAASLPAAALAATARRRCDRPVGRWRDGRFG